MNAEEVQTRLEELKRKESLLMRKQITEDKSLKNKQLKEYEKLHDEMEKLHNIINN